MAQDRHIEVEPGQVESFDPRGASACEDAVVTTALPPELAGGAGNVQALGAGTTPDFHTVTRTIIWTFDSPILLAPKAPLCYEVHDHSSALRVAYRIGRATAVYYKGYHTEGRGCAMTNFRIQFLRPSAVPWMLIMSGFGIIFGLVVQSLVNKTTLIYWSLGERAYFVNLPILLFGFLLGIVQVVALSRAGAKIHQRNWLFLTCLGWVVLIVAYGFGVWLMPARELVWSANPLAYAAQGAFAWGCFALLQTPLLPHRQGQTTWVITHSLGGALGHIAVARLVQQWNIQFLSTDETVLVMVTTFSAGIVFTVIGLVSGLAFPIVFAERLAARPRNWWIEELTGGSLIALAILCYTQRPIPEPLPPTVACRYTGVVSDYGPSFSLYVAPGSNVSLAGPTGDAGQIVCYDRVVETGTAGEPWRMVSAGDTLGWLPEYELGIGVQAAAATATLSPPGADLPLLSRIASEAPYVGAIAISPNGTNVAAVIPEVGVRQWRIATGEAGATLGTSEMSIEAFVFSDDGRLVVTLGDDGILRWWDVATGLMEDEVMITDRAIVMPRHILISGPGDELFVKLDDRNSEIERWNLLNHTRTAAIPTTNGWISEMSIDPSGTRLAYGTMDGAIYLLEIKTGRQIHALTGHAGAIRALDFSPNGNLLASGAFDGAILLWDVADGTLVQRLGRHRGATFGVAFSNDGESLFSVGEDGTARVWDITIGIELARAVAADELIHIALSHDGSIGAAAGKDGFVYIWSIPGRKARP